MLIPWQSILVIFHCSSLSFCNIFTSGEGVFRTSLKIFSQTILNPWALVRGPKPKLYSECHAQAAHVSLKTQFDEALGSIWDEVFCHLLFLYSFSWKMTLTNLSDFLNVDRIGIFLGQEPNYSYSYSLFLCWKEVYSTTDWVQPC